MITKITVSAIVIIFAVFMLAWKMRFAGRGKFFDNYFSVDETRAIKGMCAVFILFSHICTYLADYFPAFFLFKYAGAIMVGGFFFVSGYGLQYGVMNKENYLKGFFKKRLLTIAVPYYIINAFYIVTNQWAYDAIIRSLFGFYLWYVMAITIFYIGFYLCNRLLKPQYSPIAMTVFILLYIAVMLKLNFGYWWFNSCLAFAAGIWICRLFKSFTEFFKRLWHLKLVIIAAVFAVTYYYYCHHANDTTLICLLITLVNTTAFAVMLAALAMKVQINNPILRICGDLSLELYLTHALWITWLRDGTIHSATGTLFDNNIMYLIGIVAGTLIMSLAVHTVSGLILGNRRKILEKRTKI